MKKRHSRQARQHRRSQRNQRPRVLSVKQGAERRAYVITLDDLKTEVRTAVKRYFAPVVAAYGELEKTVSTLPAAWQHQKLQEEKGTHKR